MTYCLLLILWSVVTDAAHFNGGTIRWIPVNPYDNSSSITITIIQSYWWTYPKMTCANDVPISTSAYSTSIPNLICIADCSTDGGYSVQPVNILTDCGASSSAVGMMTSQRSVRTTLASEAHFYLAYQGNAWRQVYSSSMPASTWSIASFVNLQMRSDGFLNTPPLARTASPQYVVVNKTAEIKIIVSDVNPGDDIRCRWSQNSANTSIDECGGVCYPSTMPSGVILSNCTLFFQGTTNGTWYAAAIQARNNSNSLKITSSSITVCYMIVAVPTCTEAPIMMPLTGCSEVTIGVLKTVDIYVLNLCNPSIATIADVFITSSSQGMRLDNLTNSSVNSSLFYKTLTWTPQADQMGPQQLCVIAYTNEFVQSTEYCITFVGKASTELCVTTSTTTSTSSTSTTTSTSSTSTATITDAETSTSGPGKGPSWGLIAGILSAALPLALCCFCCLYRLFWSPAAKRRREGVVESENRWKFRRLTSNRDSIERTTTPRTTENSQIEVPKNSYQVYNVLAKEGGVNTNSSTIDSGGSILVAMYNNSNGRRATSIGAQNPEESVELGNAWMKPRASGVVSSSMPVTRCMTMPGCSMTEAQKFKVARQSLKIDHRSITEGNTRAFSTPPFDIGPSIIPQSHLEIAYRIDQARRLGANSLGIKKEFSSSAV